MMEKKINFSNCEVDITRAYGGANGNKIGIIYNGENYMLKFPPKPTKNQLSYTNSCFSEHISCKILNSLGLKAQKTILGEYKDKIVVACRDFTEDDKRFFDFGSLKNTIIDSQQNGYGTELEDILLTINEQKIYDNEKLKERFWDMFVSDSLIGNFDRHNGNWGFTVKLDTKEIELAPIFDCGSCLFPQNDDKQMELILKNKKALEDRVYSVPMSAIKFENVKINYYNFLTTTDNKDCLKSLKKIYSRIDLEKINKIIDETPYISDIYKKFLKTIIKERKEKILDKSMEINKNIEKLDIENAEEEKNQIDEILEKMKSGEEIDFDKYISEDVKIETETKIKKNFEDKDLSRE